MMRDGTETHGREVATAGRAGAPALANAYGDEKRFDVQALSPAERQAMAAIVKGVPHLDGAAVNEFGAARQRAASRHLDELMGQVTAADAGVGGALLAELATGLKMLDLPGLRAEAEGTAQGWARSLSRLPVVGSHLSAFARFVANRQRLIDLLAAVERRGEADLAKLKGFDVTLERLARSVRESLEDMRIALIAGQVILDRERREFAAARDAAVAGGDVLRLTEVRDRGETIDAFETRLLRLHAAYTRAVIEIPQIRMSQRAGWEEYRNVLDTLLFDVPEIKRRIITLAALRNTRLANAGAEARRSLNAALGRTAMDELEAASAASKRAQGGALAEIDEMGEVVGRLAALVDKGAGIDARNRVERATAHERLAEVRANLAAGLTAALTDQVASSTYGER